jgi:hypothetical protein
MQSVIVHKDSAAIFWLKERHMPELKLAKLPDRTPTKFSITVNSELAQGLRE